MRASLCVSKPQFTSAAACEKESLTPSEKTQSIRHEFTREFGGGGAVRRSGLGAAVGSRDWTRCEPARWSDIDRVSGGVDAHPGGRTRARDAPPLIVADGHEGELAACRKDPTPAHKWDDGVRAIRRDRGVRDVERTTDVDTALAFSDRDVIELQVAESIGPDTHTPRRGHGNASDVQ